MKKEFAMAWVKALRSRKYKQGSSALKNDAGEYCCLGVLNEINGRQTDSDVLTDADCTLYGISTGHGAKRDNTRITLGKIKTLSLAGANDIHGVSFRKIAAWIEKNYKKL